MSSGDPGEEEPGFLRALRAGNSHSGDVGRASPLLLPQRKSWRWACQRENGEEGRKGGGDPWTCQKSLTREVHSGFVTIW